jgi:hypothetical protein
LVVAVQVVRQATRMDPLAHLLPLEHFLQRPAVVAVVKVQVFLFQVKVQETVVAVEAVAKPADLTQTQWVPMVLQE